MLKRREKKRGKENERRREKESDEERGREESNGGLRDFQLVKTK